MRPIVEIILHNTQCIYPQISDPKTSYDINRIIKGLRKSLAADTFRDEFGDVITSEPDEVGGSPAVRKSRVRLFRKLSLVLRYQPDLRITFITSADIEDT